MMRRTPNLNSPNVSARGPAHHQTASTYLGGSGIGASRRTTGPPGGGPQQSARGARASNNVLSSRVYEQKIEDLEYEVENLKIENVQYSALCQKLQKECQEVVMKLHGKLVAEQRTASSLREELAQLLHKMQLTELQLQLEREQQDKRALRDQIAHMQRLVERSGSEQQRAQLREMLSAHRQREEQQHQSIVSPNSADAQHEHDDDDDDDDVDVDDEMVSPHPRHEEGDEEEEHAEYDGEHDDDAGSGSGSGSGARHSTRHLEFDEPADDDDGNGGGAGEFKREAF